MRHTNPIPALARVCAAALLLAAAPACKGSTEPDLPATIRVCETNTATLCADKLSAGSTYVADWAQGSHATIRASEFGGSDVVFIRDDPSGTSAGMHAVYTGTAVGRTVSDGVVVWSRDGVTVSGAWTAQW
jgi:hypothetical protein